VSPTYELPPGFAREFARMPREQRRAASRFSRSLGSRYSNTGSIETWQMASDGP
jgi:hypothetical protein